MTPLVKNILRIISGLLALWILWYFKTIVLYMVLAWLFSLLGHPLTEALCRLRIYRFRVVRSVNAVITLVLVWSVIFMFFRIFIPIVINQANELSQIDYTALQGKLEGPIQRIDVFFENMGLVQQQPFSMKSYVSQNLAPLFEFSMISGVFGSLASTLGNLFIAVFSITFIAFFILKDKYLIPNAFILFVPPDFQDKAKHAFISINRLLVRYFVGIFMEVSLVILLMTLGLSIIGLSLEHVLIIGLVAGIMNVIPYLGPLIGASFGLVLTLITHISLSSTELLPLLGWVALVFLLVQLIDNIIFQPLIYSSSVHAHPLEVYLVILAAGSIAGISGMVLAIPTFTILRVIAKEFFYRFEVVKQLTIRM